MQRYPGRRLHLQACTRNQQDDFVTEIAPYYANAITAQEFVAQA
ncbi:hypothetical protein [Agrobacterium rubi]|nr:hypothetical protein [Agrobacterium rubi]